MIFSKSRVKQIIGVVLIATFLSSFFVYLKYQQFLQTPVQINNQVPFEIKKGQSVYQLANQLAAENIISDTFWLRLMVRLNPELSKIKTGEFSLPKNLTPKALMQILVEGKVVQYSITIVEGMSIYQVMERFAKNQYLTNDLPKTEAELAKRLSLSSEKVEGWLYPETYFFTKSASGLSVIKRAYQKMQQILELEWQNRTTGLPYESSYEALIMASIIEKETGLSNEREKVAGVFVKRLQEKMRLQTDPTVIYGIGPDFNGDITYKDLRTATPYNTYVIKGLPPSPIAMPSKASIKAALNPEIGEWLYFVATGNGGHKFSKTLKEHNKAVKDYLKSQKNKP